MNLALAACGLAMCGFAGCDSIRTDIAVPGNNPRALAVGHLNGGRDAVIVGHDLTPSATGEDVGATEIVASKGDALRSAPIALTDFEPDSLLLVDLNGDGNLDLVASRNLGDNGGTVRILLGREDGTFYTAGDLEGVGTPLAIAAGKLDPHGNVDIVVSSAGAGAPLQVHRGRGDGTFERPEVYYNVQPSQHVAVGDVNGDGKLEVILGTTDGSVDVLLNDGTGGLLAPIRTRVGEGDVEIVLGDVDARGWPSIIASPAESRTLSVVSGLGSRFTQKSSPLDSRVDDLAAGDVYGDGKVEVVTLDTDASAISVLKRATDGSYATSKTISVGARPVALALADLHGTGALEALTANQRDGTVSVIHFYPETPALPAARRR